MKHSSHRTLAILIAAPVLAALACQFSLPNISNLLAQSPPSNNTLPQPEVLPTLQVSSNLLSQQDALISLYQTVSPGVVSIAVATDQGGGLASGFVIDKEGHIVTNYHVVQDATYMEVSFTSGFKAVADVVGVDTDSDLAVIQVDAPEGELVPLALGDSDSLQVGQYVVAIGNPFGYNGSMSVGVVSSLGRSLESMNESPGSGQFFSAGDIIQTDAAINPGNSGGPLLNLQGEVVGVNRAIESFNFDQQGRSLNSGIAFAVSSNIVKRVVPSLISQGRYDYPYLGITSVSNLTLADAKQLGLENANGALVSEVADGGPADQAGVQANDMIIAMDGIPMKNFDQMIAYLFGHKNPGDTVKLTVIRNGQKLEIDLVLGARP